MQVFYFLTSEQVVERSRVPPEIYVLPPRRVRRDAIAPISKTRRPGNRRKDSNVIDLAGGRTKECR
jgi:hypothetical protein